MYLSQSQKSIHIRVLHRCFLPKLKTLLQFCIPSHIYHLDKLTTLEFLYEWIEQEIVKINSIQKDVQEFKAALDSLLNFFFPYLNFNIQQIPQLGVSQIDSLIKDLSKIEDCEKTLLKQLNQSIEQGKSIVNEILKKIKNQTDLKYNNYVQLPHSDLDKLNLEQTMHSCILQPNFKPFTYELIQCSPINQDENCFTIVFNKDCSIVALGCNEYIKIFELKQRFLNQIQVLNGHKYDIFNLHFMKKSDQFISGDCKGYILIWQNNNNYWIRSQAFKGHKDAIRCLILNNNEDILISSSSDHTIKFWIKKDKWICQQTITNHTNYVDQLSLNDLENQVISCGWDKQILVIEYSKYNQEWIVIQNIEVECEGRKLCFINNNLFTFQPEKGNQMHIYEINGLTKKFTKTKDIIVNQSNDDKYGLFGQQFIRQKQLLVDKHDKCVNLIRKTQNDEFQVEQSIQFDSNCLYGQMSDDGDDYLGQIIQRNINQKIYRKMRIIKKQKQQFRLIYMQYIFQFFNYFMNTYNNQSLSLIFEIFYLVVFFQNQKKAPLFVRNKFLYDFIINLVRERFSIENKHSYFKQQQLLI
ncbi:unnamed protein product [Paramecium pentaurelia]|uniref:Uncharacterized protein n=1 Tax=Paramecium pentaurelia TaxID=43138 RepID=A0A8S1YJ04_9CILI|nr:unnamed protein product [Paramecium pentaurelia]